MFFEDENIRIRAFGSTDVGIFFPDRSGKANCCFIESVNLTPQEVAKAEGDYLWNWDILAQGKSDICISPCFRSIHEQIFMRGAEQFVDRIKTDVLVPMHFWETSLPK